MFGFVFGVDGGGVDVDAFAVGQAGPPVVDPVLCLHMYEDKTLGLEMEDVRVVYFVR